MYDFAVEFTIPRQTALDSPATLSVPLHQGWLSEVWIGFPYGCGREVNLQIYKGGSIILPFSAEQYYTYDDAVLVRRCRVKLDTSPYDVILKGWAPDTVYPHTLSLTFFVEEDQPRTFGELILAMFGGKVG